jgi:hypothetical protein
VAIRWVSQRFQFAKSAYRAKIASGVALEVLLAWVDHIKSSWLEVARAVVLVDGLRLRTELDSVDR